jgi:hypothetical protein
MIKNEPNEIKQISEKFYGIYRGVIEDDNPTNSSGDKLQDGRVRIRVWGLHTKNKTDIPTDNLPLAQPAYPVVIGSITGKGMWSVPVQGTHVFVFFENGDHMQPRYFATAPGIEPDDKPDSSEGFADPDGIYPLTDLMGEADMNRLMWSQEEYPDATAWENITEGTFPECRPILTEKKFEPGPHVVTYPNNFVMETRGENKGTLEINDNATLLYHNGSSYIVMKSGKTLNQGNLEVLGDIRSLSGNIHNTLKVCTVAAKDITCQTLEATIVIITPQLILARSDLASTYDSHTHECPEGGTTGGPSPQIGGGSPSLPVDAVPAG